MYWKQNNNNNSNGNNEKFVTMANIALYLCMVTHREIEVL